MAGQRFADARLRLGRAEAIALGDMQYQPATDAIAVSPVALSTCGFMVGPKVPESVRTLRQFADWAKAQPEPQGYASPAAGAMPPMPLGAG